MEHLQEIIEIEKESESSLEEMRIFESADEKMKPRKSIRMNLQRIM